MQNRAALRKFADFRGVEDVAPYKVEWRVPALPLNFHSQGRKTPPFVSKNPYKVPRCRPERGHKGLFWVGKDACHPQVTLTTMRLIQPKGVFRTVGSKLPSPSALARLQERTRIPLKRFDLSSPQPKMLKNKNYSPASPQTI